jgi:ribonuclease HI
VWKIFFDGASSKEGVGAGVVLVSPAQETIALSYKLEFEATNNVAEYEALVLGLRAAKDMGIEEISVFGDAELIVHQVKNIYQAKHPRLRSYRNEVWDLIDNFFLAFNISFIPREENIMVDSLAVSASNFRVPLPPKHAQKVKKKAKIKDGKVDLSFMYKGNLPQGIANVVIKNLAIDVEEVYIPFNILKYVGT